jgi:hypothetical protein
VDADRSGTRNGHGLSTSSNNLKLRSVHVPAREFYASTGSPHYHPLNVQFRLRPDRSRFKLSVMQPKPKPESLEDLLVDAEHYENFPMRDMRRLAAKTFQGQL